MSAHHPLHTAPVVASADEFAAQAPTMLLYTTPQQQQVAAAAAAPFAQPSLKRRASSGGSASKRARDDSSHAHHAHSAFMHSSSHVVSAPMLADGGAAHAAGRRCAPSFAHMPNAVTQQPPPQTQTQTHNGHAAHSQHAHGAVTSSAPHAATAAAAASSPHIPAAAAAVAAALPAAAPLRFPKRHLKSLAHDLASFTGALSKQSIGVVQELLPARIVAITRMEREFEREWKAETAATAAATSAASTTAMTDSVSSSTATPEATSAAATAAAASSSPASRSALQAQSTAVVPALPTTLQLLHPLPSLTEHAPWVRSSLPAPAAQCTQHGWSFLQPPRAVASDPFTSRWVRALTRQLADFQSLLGVLRVSLTLNQPSATDTNNVSLEVSEEMFAELRAKEEWAMGLRARLHGSFQIRAKCLSKVVKYPGVADYAAAIVELDAGLRCTLFTGLQSLRNSLIVIREKYGRNMERLLLDPAGDQAFQSMI